MGSDLANLHVPQEIWFKVLGCLELEDLWEHARPVCQSWKQEAEQIARSALYEGSECEVSMLDEVVEAVKYYDRDFLYPIESGNTHNLSYPSRLVDRSPSKDQLLIWVSKTEEYRVRWVFPYRRGAWWPVIIRYKSAQASRVRLRLNYESQLYPVDDSEMVFSRHKNSSAPETGRADWMVYSADMGELKAEQSAGFSALTIPLWQLVRLVLEGSVWDDEDKVSECSIGSDDNLTPRGKSPCYYVWT